MTSAANRTRRWTVAVFAIALMTRLLWISVPLNVDEELWMRRGPAFMQAVLQGKAADTYQRHHPGVTNRWLIGGTVASRYLLRALTPADAMARQTAPELQRCFAGLPAYLAEAWT